MAEHNAKAMDQLRVERNKLYLVTGGSGFLGKPLVEYITTQGAFARVLARSECALIYLKEDYPDVEILTGDVGDKFSVRQAITGVHGIFHLAAFKHVGLAETQSVECIRSNVIGSLNVYEEALNHDVHFILAISTDKAVQINGVYGASKFLMERICQQFQALNPSCAYRLVRYGNVLYSTGSVLCKWQKLITEGKKVIVTDPNATRFFWSIDQAIELIDHCLLYAKDCSPYCPTMKSIKIADLLQAMIEKYSNGQEIDIEEIGLQPGENMHEKILEEGPYSNEVEQFTVEEIKVLI